MASKRNVIVDDSSDLIQYHGEWFTENGTAMDNRGNYGPIYNMSQHGTLSNASLTFHYEGTYFAVMGTNDINNDTGIPDPQWECFVDNIKVDSNPFKIYENNWWLCELKSIFLDDGPHVLIVNATVKDRPFWIDRIDYTPSPSVNMEDKTVFVDHTDPEIQYGAGWEAMGMTANITRQVGSKVNFFFYGISVSWFGYRIASPASGIGSWSIDDSPLTRFSLSTLPGDDPAQYNQEFFRTPDYPKGYHKLTVMYSGPSNTEPLILDYLVVRNVTQSGATDVLQNAHQKAGGANIAVIIAGSLVALALILFAILLFLYIQKRRKSPHAPSRLPHNTALNRTPRTPRPFISNLYHEQYISGPYDPPRSAHKNDRRYARLSEDNAERHRHSVSLSHPSEPNHTFHDIPQASSSAQPRVLRHEDSGLRNIEAEPLLEVPPSYTAG